MLNIPALSQLQILLDSAAAQWRFKVDTGKLQIDESAQFTQAIEREPNIFAIICAAVARGE